MTVIDLTPLWISLKTAGLATVVTSILGIAAAYGMLGDRQPGKSLIESIFIAPLILPPLWWAFCCCYCLAKMARWEKSWPNLMSPSFSLGMPL
ncbi:hypothetical protein NON20_06540 [Synechocystis sp. B12]|nr:hypothetical protein NON20_06540 [Synechocystis sp. B12]